MNLLAMHAEIDHVAWSWTQKTNAAICVFFLHADIVCWSSSFVSLDHVLVARMAPNQCMSTDIVLVALKIPNHGCVVAMPVHPHGAHDQMLVCAGLRVARHDAFRDCVLLPWPCTGVETSQQTQHVSWLGCRDACSLTRGAC